MTDAYPRMEARPFPENLPLLEHLKARIGAEGPLTVADYMRTCLLHPEHGYYTGQEPFGRSGDFVTAPDISQIFGELIGLWCGAVWQQLGAPERIILVETGPGRGTLMADALRAMRIVPGLHEALDIHLLEASPRLRAVQRAALPDIRLAWHGTPETLPACPALFIGNEFFDALPIRQLRRHNGVWRERLIDRSADGDRLVWGDGPASPELVSLIPSGAGAPEEGDIAEISEAARATMSRLARHLALYGGAGLFIDYGHGQSAFGDTFQAVRGHGYVDVLAAPGASDLSAHVDFQSLLEAAAEAGCTPFGAVSQGRFLDALGIGARLLRLLHGAAPERAAMLRSGVSRLIDPAGMGRLFKAIAIAAPGITALPGFAARPAPARAVTAAPVTAVTAAPIPTERSHPA